MSSQRDAKRETNVRLLLLALAAVLVSLVLFWIAAHESWMSGPWQSVLENVAGLVLATGLLGAAWDIVGRRRFASEVLAKAKLSADVVDAGMQRVTDQYLDEVEWADLFSGATHLDIVVAYARTWRNAHAARLNAVAANPSAKIRVFLPDPDDTETMRVLADRFGTDESGIAVTVREAVAYYKSLQVIGGASVEVWLRPGDAVFSCYRFDQRAVLTLYSHSKERKTSVPTFVVGSGILFKFIRDEIDAIHDQSTQAP